MGWSAKVDTSEAGLVTTVEKKCFFGCSTLGSSFSKPNGPTPLPFRIRFTLIMKSKNLLSIHCAEKELSAENWGLLKLG